MIKTHLKNIFAKLLLVITTSLLLSGYHPVFNFPIKTVQAQVDQTQQVISAYLETPIVLPHPGYLSTLFSSFHPGVDIATGLGMPIHPITKGIVEETVLSFWGLGNHVIISHQNGLKSTYGHMATIYVKKNQQVDSVNIIGEVGLTGASNGPHTHLEIQRFGQYIDPLTILPKIPPYHIKTSINPTFSRSLKPDF